MTSLIAPYILDEIQISEDIEITFDSLLGDIKHCCKTRSVYRDIYRDICSIIYRAIFYDMVNLFLSFSKLR